MSIVLDHAALASVDRVRIVHGHGMGILKKAVANLLAKSPHVEKFYPASPQEGGAGATIAQLRRPSRWPRVRGWSGRSADGSEVIREMNYARGYAREFAFI